MCGLWCSTWFVEAGGLKVGALWLKNLFEYFKSKFDTWAGKHEGYRLRLMESLQKLHFSNFRKLSS